MLRSADADARWIISADGGVGSGSCISAAGFCTCCVDFGMNSYYVLKTGE